jgi:hypothetical protein
LDGTLNDRLQKILVERRMAGGDTSNTGGVGIDPPNAITCLSQAPGSHTSDAPQANDSDAVLHDLV